MVGFATLSRTGYIHAVMWRSTRSTLLILLLSSVSGCEWITEFAEKRANLGSNLGFDQCVRNNSDVGLSVLKVRELCIKQHEKRITVKVKGRAGYNCPYFQCAFSGDLTNEAADKIVTSIKIYIRHEDNKDDEGRPKLDIAHADNLWIEPGALEAVYFTGFTFQPAKDRLREGDDALYTWGIQETRGIEVKLK